LACTCTLLTSGRPYAERCREVANGSLSGQGEKEYARLTILAKSLRESPSIPETRGNVLGTRAGRKTRERSTFENDRESEPDMTTYPLEFHRRSEQKWVLRAQASSARETAALVGSSQRGQRRSGESEHRDILAEMPWLREIGQWLRAGYDAVDQPVPERLAALLKELKGRRRH
jgi:Anti-sigma factor NepR